MDKKTNLEQIRKYFHQKLSDHGTTPRGVDWNSESAQDTRFEQLIKIIDPTQPYSILDYGSGFGSLFDYLEQKGHTFGYMGYDIVPEMIEEGKRLHAGKENCKFTSLEADLAEVDYSTASGIFNIKLQHSHDDWTGYVIDTIGRMNRLSRKGISFNLLTKYSDPEYMQARPDLYYADPCFFFDYCKRNFSRNVALLHDYELYDFTILVRK